MPWHLVANHSKCGQGKVAVVKDSTGDVVACHDSRQKASKHMAALYANEPARSSDPPSEWRVGGPMTTVTSVAERRLTVVAVEARAGKEDRRTIGGYAAVFNKMSHNLGGFVEQVAPSFFTRNRGDGFPDVLARYNHDDNMLLGTIAGRTLRLSIDEMGLHYEVDLPQARADVYELIQRGDVQKSSFAFRLVPEGDEWTMTEQGYPMRTLVHGQLVDVAPVNTPAYPDSTVGQRKLIDPTLALRSLAERVEASIEDVQAAALENELHRFLVRTGSDQPMPKAKVKPKLFGPSAAASILMRESDPWA